MSFAIGDKVFKPKGYPYPGTVVAAFENLAGDKRYVVESELAPGMLHIFSPTQLELSFSNRRCSECRHPMHNHGQPDPYEESLNYPDVDLVCTYFVGMGDWCGCKETV